MKPNNCDFFEATPVTAWFLPAQIPARIGLYETKFVGVSDNAPKVPDGETEIHRWDGKRWTYPVKGREEPRWCQSAVWHWRGLAQPG